MEEFASSLVLTKLHIPAPRAGQIPRTHLIERLTREPQTGLIFICAPAGYGKTTLLSEWARALIAKGTAVGWFAIDPSDDDPVPFCTYLVASLMQALGSTPELSRIAQLIRSSPELDMQKIMGAIINAIASSEWNRMLILDDYHLIGSPAIHSAIAFLLEHHSENMCIVLGSRSEPPLPLARLRARGQLLEIRTADLRFRPDETARFLNEVMHLDLSGEMIATLNERTEGWAAGLQLAALSLTGRSDKESFLSSFSGGHRYVVEFLLEEVVNRQPDEVQSFLLNTSVLERFCAPLCDALLKDERELSSFTLHAERSSFILDYLEQANLFVIPLDDEQKWYRYHHLFRDFLQTWLNKIQPERVTALHRAACEWHAAHGFLREAVHHALQTQDWEYAAALVEQHGVPMMLHGEISTMYEWCAAFPEAVMRIHPSLCLFQGNALVLGYRRQNRSKIEELLQQVEQAAAALDAKRKPLARVLIGQAATTRTFLAAVTPDPAIDPRDHFPLAQRALDLLSEDDPARSAVSLTIGYAYLALHDPQAGYQAMEESRQMSLACHNYFGVVEATFHQARLAHHQGHLRHAAEICRQGRAEIAVVLAHPERELPAVGCLDIALGCVLLEQDQLEGAEQALLHGLDLIGWGMNPFYVMIACTALFRLRGIQGRSEEALDYLNQLEESWPDIAFLTRGLRVVHALQGASQDPSALAEAVSWCNDFLRSLGEDMPTPGMGPFGAAEAYYLASLIWSRTQISLGNSRITLSYLKQQLGMSMSHGLVTRVIELSLLEAQAMKAEGNSEESRVALERAFSLAEPEGYVRIFDQEPASTQMLMEAIQQGIHPDLVRRVLAAIGPAPISPTGIAEKAIHTYRLESGEQLSERELEVLRLMACGATNQEIATQLVITVGTVKSHINHVLRKLDAHNRTEAVARARDLGLPKI